MILENEEKIIIDSFRKQLLEFESKYEKLMKEEEIIYTIKVNIDNGIKKFNDEVKGWKKMCIRDRYNAAFPYGVIVQ